jgi:hypothetical protein
MADDRRITAVLEWDGILKPTPPEMTDLSHNEVENGMIKSRQDCFSGKVWFVCLAIMILLVIGGVETNPGPQVEQVKINQILAYDKNQKKGGKAIKQMLETHK